MARYRLLGIVIGVVALLAAGSLLGSLFSVNTSCAAGNTYTYKLVPIAPSSPEAIEALLNEQGKEGWRFVPVVGMGSFVFER